MLLEKTFHMCQSLAESKARLTSIQSYKRQFLMVTKATVTSSKTVDFSFRGPLGFDARTVLLSVDSDSIDQFAFESVGGNLDVIGLVDFTEIRPNCTEITLAIHYKIKNRLFAWLDRRFGFVDAFVNAELRSIRAHFEGIATPYVEPLPMMPLLETAAAA
jgi:ribosome-associated toxin RatA of RatAB toxin-antitoxin module